MGGGLSAELQESPRIERARYTGTWLLSILSGHWRYAHVSAIRADGVNPRLLGMRGSPLCVGALKAIDETLGREWLSRHLGRTVLGLLEADQTCVR